MDDFWFYCEYTKKINKYIFIFQINVNFSLRINFKEIKRDDKF